MPKLLYALILLYQIDTKNKNKRNNFSYFFYFNV
ncbi:hypothetical protein QMO_2762, partial [Clostridioides difficile DA00305]